jgi:hypothetical protein
MVDVAYGSANGDERERTEQMALIALLAWPRLADELGIEPGHFLTDSRRQATVKALSESISYMKDGSAVILDVTRRAGIADDWIKSELSVTLPSFDAGRHWVKKLSEEVLTDRIRAEMSRVLKKYKGPDLLGAIGTLIGTLEQLGTATDVEDLESISLSYIQKEQESIRSGRPPGLPTGLKTLDRYLRGWRPQELTVLVAGPGVGKSTMADNWCRTLAMRKIYSLLFSGEMTRDQLGERHVHHVLRMPMDQQYAPGDVGVDQLSWAQQQVVERGLAKYVIVDRRPEFTPARLLAVTRSERRKRGSIGLSVIDHLRHLKATESTENFDKVSAAVQESKNYAKTGDVAALLITHLNRSRKGVGTAGEEPDLTMIRGSGQIEEDADNVLCPFRTPDGRTWLKILKARQAGGIINVKIELAYDRDTQSYGEIG